MTRATLYYVADPMCSWCWGFAPQLERVVAELPGDVEVRHVMGGLAPDSDEPMPLETRASVQRAWDAVEARAGVPFERSFWERCEPRRSTYPACRAVVAAGLQNAGPAMFAAIQRAYYTQARNPSDATTLIELAAELGLDLDRFESDLRHGRAEELLRADLALRDELGVTGFPTLVLEKDDERRVVRAGYATADEVQEALREAGVA